VLARAHADAEDGRLDDDAYLRLLRWLTGERTVTFREGWSAWRTAPVVTMINVFDLVRLPHPDGVVFLRSAPESRMRALRSAGLELDERENEEHLAKLQQGYRRALELLEKRYRIETIVSEGEAPETLAARAAAHWAPVVPHEEGSIGAH